MSYINDALKKAQGERDSRYERFNGIIAPSPAPSPRPRRKRFLAGGLAALAVVATAALLLTVYVRNPSPPSGKGSRPSLPAAVSASSAAVQTKAPQAVAPAAGSSASPAAAPHAVQAATPQAEDKLSPEAEAGYQAAVLAQRKRDLDKAETLYRKVLALAPGHVQSLNNLGVLYMGQKKRDRAISMFSRAIVLRKDYVDPYYNMACLHAQNNEIDESLWYLKAAVAINAGVKKWAESDADMRNVTKSPAFKKIMEGQKS